MDIIEKLVAVESDADNFGFSWSDTSQIMDQIKSECLEVNEHLSVPVAERDIAALEEELGDLLHAVFSLTIFCNFDPEKTLANATQKFEKRLMKVKQLALDEGIDSLEGFDFEDLMRFWQKAKV